MSATLELFVCMSLPGAPKLTRSSCADRSARTKREAAGASGKFQSHLVGDACTSCPVGEAHGRGETPSSWPGGAPIDLAAITPSKPGSSRWTGGAQDSETDSRGDAKGRAPKAERGKGLPRAGAVPGPVAKPASTMEATVAKQKCPECSVVFERAHNRQKYCTKKCGKSAANRRSNAKRKRHGARKTPASPPKKSAGKKLNDLDPAPATGSRAAAGLDTLVALVDDLEVELAAVRATANLVARRQGLPAPFAAEETRAE